MCVCAFVRVCVWYVRARAFVCVRVRVYIVDILLVPNWGLAELMQLCTHML